MFCVFVYSDCNKRGQTSRPVLRAQVQTSCNLEPNTSVTVLWVLAICSTTVHFWNYLITVWYCYIAILLCLTTSISSYAKILLKLRHHQTNVQDHIYEERQSQVINILHLTYSDTKKHCQAHCGCR